MSVFTFDRRIIDASEYPWGVSRFFTPADITTALWLDAADSDTVTLVGSGVSEWQDKSGNGRHISQSSSGARPTYNIENTIIEFDGNTQHLFLSSAPFYAAGQCAVFAVIDAISISTDQHWIGEGSSSSNYPMYVMSRSSNPVATTGVTYVRTDSTSTVVLTTGNPLVGMFSSNAHINCFLDTGASITLGRNGTLGMPAGYSRTGHTLTLNRFCVGGLLRATLLGPMRFNAHEIVVTTSVPDIVVRQKLEGYLAHKYGLSDNLPSDHPYKTRAPRA